MAVEIPSKNLVTEKQTKVSASVRYLSTLLISILSSFAISIIFFLLIGIDAALFAGASSFFVFSVLLLWSLYDFNPKQKVQISTDLGMVRYLTNLKKTPVLVTNLKGQFITTNSAFDAISGGKPDLRRFLQINTNLSDCEGLFKKITQEGHVETPIILKSDRDVYLTLKGLMTGGYITWSMKEEGITVDLQKTVDALETWPSDLLEQLNIGMMLKSNDGELVFLNTVLHNWLKTSPEAMPRDVKLSDNDRLLHISGTHAEDVSVNTIPAKSFRDGNTIGQYSFISKGSGANLIQAGSSQAIEDNSIFHSAPLAIATVNSEFEIKECNRMMTRLIGKDVDTSHYSALSIVEDEYKPALQKMIEEHLNGDSFIEPLEVQFTGVDKKAGLIHVSSLMNDGDKNAILYCLDKSQEKTLEMQFVQAQKMQAVGQLAGGVAHDFNNLLTAIIGFCDLLLLRHMPGDESYADINHIKQNSNRAANLVRQLLAFSRQQTMRPKILTITDVLSDISNLLRRLIGEKIQLVMSHSRDLPQVRVDQGQLEQVIINLAVNARDAMSGGGTLEIKTHHILEGDDLFKKYSMVEPGNYVLIKVSDNGCGIPEDIRDKIFEPFFTTKEVGQGTGLGLATVYGIVKQTGGYVFLESTVGKGTSFLILLKEYVPTEEELKKIASPEEKQSKDLTGKGTILLVEDEAPVRLFASRALENKGYKVLQAISGEEGLDMVKELSGQIDLLITDVIMPNMDGPALVREIQKEYPDIPVIFISGYAEDILRGELEHKEFNFLPKPFSLKQLAETVKSILS